MTVQSIISAYLNSDAPSEHAASVAELGVVLKDELGLPRQCAQAVVDALYDEGFLVAVGDDYGLAE